MFIQAFDGNKYCCVNDTDIYALACIPEMKQNRKIWIWIIKNQNPKNSTFHR